MLDTFRHQALRQQLISTLRSKGIADEQVLAAMSRIPRHFFLKDGILADHAYRDVALEIGAEQTISQPYTVAMQTELLGVKAGEKILEIGTGSGYQAAVLCELGAELYSIERHQSLHSKAKTLLTQMGYRLTLMHGDGFEGIPQNAPFAKIIVTCGANRIPENLLKQLSVGGRMVIPIGSNGALSMYTIDRLNDTDFRQTKHGKCAFVPMLEGVEK